MAPIAPANVLRSDTERLRLLELASAIEYLPTRGIEAFDLACLPSGILMSSSPISCRQMLK
jgi:hypothetical protein